MENMDPECETKIETVVLDSENRQVTQIESMCPSCMEQGTTNLLLSNIPHFGDVVISSFICDKCHLKNTDINPTKPIQSYASKIQLKVTNKRDLNRQVVKTKFTKIMVPELEFERDSTYGEVTTVQGLLQDVVSNLRDNIQTLAQGDPDVVEKIIKFSSRLENMLEVGEPWTLVLEDLSGNSYIQALSDNDINLMTIPFKRSKENNEAVGIFEKEKEYKVGPGFGVSDTSTVVTTEEVNAIPVSCPNCATSGLNMIKLVDIPFFKEIILMAFRCESCGFRDSEVKGGLTIDEMGKKLSLTISGKADLCRDFLTSEYSKIQLPELDIECGSMEFSGHFTTVEGFLIQFKEKFLNMNMFNVGDSSKKEEKQKALVMETIFKRIEKVCEGTEHLTLLLDDPTGNSYIQILGDDKSDLHLKIERYDRTFEENESLGLNHDPYADVVSQVSGDQTSQKGQ